MRTRRATGPIGKRISYPFFFFAVALQLLPTLSNLYYAILVCVCVCADFEEEGFSGLSPPFLTLLLQLSPYGTRKEAEECCLAAVQKTGRAQARPRETPHCGLMFEKEKTEITERVLE
jgi:hypothetical protein